MRKSAIFLDLEGTLIEDRGTIRDAEALHLLPGVIPALARLKAAGWLLVLAANQPAIGRGEITTDAHQELMDRLEETLTRADAALDGIYICPHIPWNACECRKPQPELLHRAARELYIDLRSSWMIGDRPMDVQTGINAGCRTIWLTNVWHLSVVDNEAEPDLVCRDLNQAATSILEMESYTDQ